MSSFSQRFRDALLLSFPIWGLVLALGLLSLFPKGSQMPGEPIVALGMLAPLVGAAPIFRTSSNGPVAKAILFLVYYAACAFAMFIVGWASLGVFGLTK